MGDQGGAHRLDLGPAEAAFQMIVDETHRLHESINCGRADKGPAAFLQILRNDHGCRRRRIGDDVITVDHCRPLVMAGFVAPEIMGERAEFVPELYCTLGIVDGRDDLAAMTDDAGIGKAARDIAFAEAGDFLEIET